jgi:hypothetical protein
MLIQGRAGQFLSAGVLLLLAHQGAWTAPRPAAAVSRPVLTPVLQWVFADIHLTALGPNVVKIDWVPVPGADQYQLYRNEGLFFTAPAIPTDTRIQTFTDNAAPVNSTVKYYVIAAHKKPIAGTPIISEQFMAQSHEVSVVTPMPLAPVLAPLHGFVDLHTHPMSYLGFGGKLIYGAVDMGSVSQSCNPARVASEYDALGLEYQVFGKDSPCGSMTRSAIIPVFEYNLNSAFYPDTLYHVSGPQSRSPIPLPPGAPLPRDFPTWPAWNDLLHQKMWIDWIKRAHDGGLSVMVALAVNNRLLGDITSGPSDLTDDLKTTNTQIDEIKGLASRNPFMKVVYDSAGLHDAVSQGLLAVVIGVEIDNIGDSVGNVPAATLISDIDQLYTRGVRYIFPVHVVDNPIGGTAVYQDLFNVANVYEENAPWSLTCVNGNTYEYTPPSAFMSAIAGILLGWSNAPSIPGATPCQSAYTLGGGDPKKSIGATPHGKDVGYGNVNTRGLTEAGKAAIQHMMDLGMLIDVDHMSELSVNATLVIAEANYPVHYPLNSGHNVLRGAPDKMGNPNPDLLNERYLTALQYQRIGALHGMIGIGSAKAMADEWSRNWTSTVAATGAMANSGIAAFGTDADGMEFMMPPRPGSAVDPAHPASPFIPPLPTATDGTRTWIYNNEGVAHYGLLPDFLSDVATILPNGPAQVAGMFSGAQYFYDTWRLAESDKKVTCYDMELYSAASHSCVCPPPSQVTPWTDGATYCGCPMPGAFFNPAHDQCEVPTACPVGSGFADLRHPFTCVVGRHK